MVMDNIGLASAVALTHACRNSAAARRVLPLAAFPVLALGDLYSIYRQAAHCSEGACIFEEPQWPAAPLSPRRPPTRRLRALPCPAPPRELRSIHLRTLNRERMEIIAQRWLADGRVPSPQEVSSEERLVLPPRIEGGCLPLTVGALELAVRSEADLSRLQHQGTADRYLLSFTPPCTPRPPSASGLLARWAQR